MSRTAVRSIPSYPLLEWGGRVGRTRRPPCFECGAPSDQDHHVVPRSRGGTRTIPLCADCHGKAHHGRMGKPILTRDALAAKKRRGERVGTVPLGARLADDGRTLESDHGELATLALIRRLAAEGLNPRAIAAELDRRGIPPKRGRAGWAHSTIRKVLGRPA